MPIESCMINLRIFAFFIGILLLCSLVTGDLAVAQPSLNKIAQKYYMSSKQEVTSEYLHITPSHFWAMQAPLFPANESIFTLTASTEVNSRLEPLSLALKPDLKDFYQEVGFFGHEPQKIVFVYPIFTQAAYGESGFYKYFKKKCDTSCLTVSIPTKIEGEYTSSIGAALALTLLNYPHVTDIDIDKSPDILKKYDKIILLHNEYVTKKEFDAITSHPDVVYLFPNALYAEVNANYDANTITLIRGHGFPVGGLSNGFDWKYDNTKFEYDNQCINWKFYKVQNGIMLNCYPDDAILYDTSILRAIHEEYVGDLKLDANEFLGNSTEAISNQELLGDAGVAGHSIPQWFLKPAYWFANGQITKNEFVDEIVYLYDKNVIR